ncbi:amidohydrolase family protein [Streptomyces sp. H10-C2]|uniref:amidohydrolase family protein n=1 Tax=unclassified Streptomyces TaxID=2593676 RepID=UPI0024BAD59F|nr:MULTISPECIES: amidohydrolase family protein [unclassified Streptomyces]MDJ0344844.1 amidohydrolase family protein [Streptomyces sp. PH10-H1]MDJ0371904.1 amidohydrolase family protein [Streptomyces sp. H10-C2]
MTPTGPDDRYTVISADCHAGADLLDYRPYLASGQHETFDAWAATYVNPYQDLIAPEASRNWDSGRRLAELEADGIVAEVVFPNTVPPFFPSGSLLAPAPSKEEFELRWAGLRAHNRWLADFCAQAPGRRAGVAQILLNDVDAAVREVRWAKEHGLAGGILLPGAPPGSGVPELYSAVYDPLWAVCAELDVPVNHHGGSASPPLGDEPAARAVFMVETTWFSHRALWHLMFGGAFRRHPGLRLVLTEQGSGWIPGVLDMLEYYHGRLVSAATRAATAEAKFGTGLADSMGKGPKEVWRDNCYVGASFMRPHEVPLRDRIGLEKIMWGSDYPHDEGTYPYTREGLRIAYAGLPTDEIAAMAGGNAARVYGFDLGLLDPIAAKAGPTVAEIAEPLKEPPADATSPAFAPGGSVRVW